METIRKDKRIHLRVLLILGAVILPIVGAVEAQDVTLPPQGGETPPLLQVTASDYVEIFDGDMPLMFAVGHGGWKQVGDQVNGGYAADPLLRDYFYEILAVHIYERTGHLPYVVYQQGDRNYVNVNRPVGSSQAYHPDNTEARDAYFEFHNQVDATMARIEARYGADMALMINPHTTDLDHSVGSRPWDRIAEIGFVASVTNPGTSSNTMKALYDRKGQAALHGEDSIPYQLFHAQEWPDPGAVWPVAAAINSKTLARTGDDVWHVLPAYVTGWGTDDWVTAYFNGSSTILYHGTNTLGHHSNWSNGLDAFQMEVNYTKEAGLALDEPGDYQLDVPFATNLMDDLIDAILHSLRVNYNWTPGGVYNVIVDNGDAGFGTTGSWPDSDGEGFWGTPSVHTGEASATATWTPNLAQSGTYEVLIRWTKHGTRTQNAQYTVNSAGGSSTFAIDQSGGRDAKWVSLGQFPFNAGTGGSVLLESTSTGDTTAADATLFRLVSSGDGIIVDNLDAGFTRMGNWHESAAGGEWAGSSLYAHDGDNEPNSAAATWTPNLPQAGRYLVFAWWTDYEDRALNAPYTITHAKGSDVARVNQRENGSRWVLLGVYECIAGTETRVTLTREAGDGVSTSADAVKFVNWVGRFSVYLPITHKKN